MPPMEQLILPFTIDEYKCSMLNLQFSMFNFQLLIGN